MRRLQWVVVSVGCLVLSVGSLVAWPAALGAAASPGDQFIEGYTAAILEREFGRKGARVAVSNGVVTLRPQDLQGIDRQKVLAAIATIPGVLAVQVTERPAVPAPPTAEVGRRPATAGESPESEALATGFLAAGRLFDPLIADPRWPHFGASYQRYLGATGFQDVGAVSFGESFSLYRDNLPLGGQWEVGLQAAVFAIFDLDSRSSDLINADYFAALTGSYRLGPWQALARFFHQSSHLGDEFLLDNSVDRVNLSYEGLGLLVSRYLFDDAFRIYGGGSVLLRRDPSDLKRGAVQYGAEFYSPWRLAPNIRPVAGIDLQNREQNSWATDLSLRAGLQFESLQVLGRKLQLAVEYFSGHSPNGQFYRDRIEYIGIGAHMY